MPHKKNKYTVLFVFFIILSLNYSLTIGASSSLESLSLEDMSKIVKSQVNINFSYLINIKTFSEDSYLYNLNIKLNLNTKNESNQKVKDINLKLKNINKEHIKKLDKKNLNIVLQDISSSKKIPLNFFISYEKYRNFPKVKGNISYPYFFSNEELKELRPYLKPDDLINYNSPVIQEQIKKITENSNDYYDVVVKSAEFVKKEIRYVMTSTTANDIKRASWVLLNREGVCDEITVLFIALLRGAGIPARFVSGISYSNINKDNPWGYHSWAEVYFPNYGWVPFDVTYGEFGYLDSLHVAIARPIHEKNEEIVYSWKSINTKVEVKKIKEQFDFKQEEIDKFQENAVKINASVNKKKVGFNSYNLITINIKNPHDYYITAVIEVISPREINFINDSCFIISLKPLEKKELNLLIKVNGDFKPGYIYTLPVIVKVNNIKKNISFEVSQFEDKYSIDYFLDKINKVKLKEHKIKPYSIKCNYNKYVYINESNIISCSIKNKQNESIKGIFCIERSCYEINLKPNEEKSLEFIYKKEKLGWQTIKIRFPNYNNELNIFVTNKPNIKIDYEWHDLINDPLEKKYLIVKLNTNKKIKNVSLNLSLKTGNKEFRLINATIGKIIKEKEIRITIPKYFIINRVNKYSLDLTFKDEVKKYKIKKSIILKLKNLTFKDKIILLSRKIKLNLIILYNSLSKK